MFFGRLSGRGRLSLRHLSLRIRWIKVKVGTNIQHVSGYRLKGFKVRGQ